MEDSLIQSPSYIKGRKRPLIDHFSIESLYGYRTLALNTDYSATIMIARNGSGKTTLLNTLNFSLRLQLTRLKTLDFEVINLGITHFEKRLTLVKTDVTSFCNFSKSRHLLAYAAQIQVTAESLFNYLVEEYNDNVSIDGYHLHPVLKQMFPAESYNSSNVGKRCKGLRDELYSITPGLSAIYQTVSRFMADTEIVYLPTYPRIELALAQENEEAVPRRPRAPQAHIFKDNPIMTNIQFGLADIVNRLSELNGIVVGRSNQAYSRLSSTIINDLLDGSFDRTEVGQIELPKKEDMKLFLDRIASANKYGPYRSIQVPSLEKFYVSNKSDDTSKFLLYFLSQLGTVLEETKQIETDIGDFIDGCNKYLSLFDSSTRLHHSPSAEMFLNPDGKKMTLNRDDLTVEVQDLGTNRNIPLDTLSSGEKQMISIFSRLYLYPKDKIVLIDEPELSLSIDWQRQILVDVILAPKCLQMIAITHSPFVFDNPLEPFARSLEVRKHPN